MARPINSSNDDSTQALLAHADEQRGPQLCQPSFPYPALLAHADEQRVTNDALRAGVEQSKLNTEALTKSAEAAAQLLAESLQLEGHLHNQVREILATQEKSRQQTSLQLQDEIAQTLLGINVRLMALKKESAANDARLREQTAITLRLVEQCIETINQFASELASPL